MTFAAIRFLFIAFHKQLSISKKKKTMRFHKQKKTVSCATLADLAVCKIENHMFDEYYFDTGIHMTKAYRIFEIRSKFRFC